MTTPFFYLMIFTGILIIFLVFLRIYKQERSSYLADWRNRLQRGDIVKARFSKGWRNVEIIDISWTKSQVSIKFPGNTALITNFPINKLYPVR